MNYVRRIFIVPRRPNTNGVGAVLAAESSQTPSAALASVESPQQPPPTPAAPPTPLRRFWRYRAPLAGLAAIALALLGEQLMRTGAGSPPNPELGQRLLQLAVLLVGVVA